MGGAPGSSGGGGSWERPAPRCPPPARVRKLVYDYREPPSAGKRDDPHCLSPDGRLMRQTEFRAKKLANKRKRYGLDF